MRALLRCRYAHSDASLPAEWRATIDELRATAAGQHALRMYKEHRFAPGAAQRRIARPNHRRW